MIVASPLGPQTPAERAVAVWRKGRSNTLTIAKTVGLPEPDVCRAIAADQDARHRARAAAGAETRR